MVMGQEMTGVVFSEYNGVTSTILNPALMTGSKVIKDVNIISGDFYVDNDIFYLPPGNNPIRKIFSGSLNLGSGGPYKYDRKYTYFDNANKKFISASARFMLPSYMLQKNYSAFAITTAIRSYQSGNHIPYQIPIQLYEDLGFEPYVDTEFNNEKFSMVSMTWFELGLSYAYDLKSYHKNKWTLGISAKALFGLEGAYVEVRKLNYNNVDPTTVDFKNFDVDFGYALPVDQQTNKFMINPLIKGYGFGFDLGLVYTKRLVSGHLSYNSLFCKGENKNYRYKIGISLLDLGWVRFKKNAQLHRFDNVSVYWEHFDTIHYQSLEGILQDYSTAFYGDPNTSYHDNKIIIGTPTTVSVQFDYQIINHLFVGALWMHPVRFNLRTVWRPALATVVPRFEKRSFAVSLPISLIDYHYPQIGLALRYYSFTIGTGNLIPWIGNQKFTGFDIYFSFRLNLNISKCDLDEILKHNKKGACSNSGFGNRDQRLNRRR